MSIADLGSLGEFISSIAVLVTLIYLVKQVRDNNKLIDTNVYESFMSSYTELNQAVTSNPDVAKSAAMFIYGSDEQLTQIEALRLNQFIRWYCNNLKKMFRLYERGVLPENDWDMSAKEAHQLMTSSEFGRTFMEHNHYFDDLWPELELRADRDRTITNFGVS